MEFIAKLIKEGRLDKRVLEVIEREQLSFTYKFKPEEIQRMPITDYYGYLQLSTLRKEMIK